MMVKTPITDADAIRALACKALAGLARSDKIRQIISKLPLFANGQLQGEFRLFFFYYEKILFYNMS